MANLVVNSEDMIYNKVDGQVMAGGYAVNSLFLAENIPLFKQVQAMQAQQVQADQMQQMQAPPVLKCEKFSDRFQNLAVPAGLLFINTHRTPLHMNPLHMNPLHMNPLHMNPLHMNPESQPINDDLYNKLLALVQTTDAMEQNNAEKPAKKKKTTRKQKNKKMTHKKTKKSYA